jgi:dihydropteroate synthase
VSQKFRARFYFSPVFLGFAPLEASLANPARHWKLGSDKALLLDRPRILAILNLTPDSFSDGGRYPGIAAAVEAAAKAVEAGADMLDIGGESTRPGAARVAAEVQIERTIPVIEAIRAAGGPLAQVPISIDTTLSRVAQNALDAGANAINDVSAGLEDPDVFPLAAARGSGLILMHRLSPPERDSYSDRYTQPPAYGEVVGEVGAFLGARAQVAIDAGVAPEAIVVDPGLGFGKTVEQNLELVRRTGELCRLGFPVVSAASRKSFVAAASGVQGQPISERLSGSLALSVMHLFMGAIIFRVHDVAAQAQALRAAHAAWGKLGAGGV